MSVLVTGGAGYVGSHALRELRRHGIPHVVLDNLSRGHRDLAGASDLVVGDVADRALVRRLIGERGVTAVLHFAAFAYVGESVREPAMYYRNNVVGTVALLEEMVAAGVARIVFSSTCSTYGEPEIVPIPEDHPQRPLNPYGAGKLMVERILQDFDRAYGLRSVALRYFNAAGADPSGEIGERHTPETHLIPLVLQAALGQRDAIDVFGTDYPTPDGTCVRDYIHVTDLADAHVRALQYLEAGEPSVALNLGNGTGFSVREVIDTARHVTGKKIRAHDAPRRPGDPARLVGSADRAARTLGWRPRFGALEFMIESAWRWHQTEARRGN